MNRSDVEALENELERVAESEEKEVFFENDPDDINDDYYEDRDTFRDSDDAYDELSEEREPGENEEDYRNRLDGITDYMESLYD